MAESLKHLLGRDATAHIASMLHGAWLRFDRRAFLAEVEAGYDELDLMARGRRIAEALRRQLPQAYPRAVEILVASMGPAMGLDAAGEPVSGDRAHSAFLYLPHSMFIAAHGLAHLEESLRAQHALTQRFTAEFSLRPFLQQHQAATLARLLDWTLDPSAHVRRAASEGTRPRLPWAPRLRGLMADPRPVLPLLERLRDDPSSYVRRSVANHLNDIGKDHPALLNRLARDWQVGAPPERQRLVRHALRFAVKRGDREALETLGLAHAVRLDVNHVAIQPKRPAIGGAVGIAFELHNPGRRTQQVLADLRVHYVKSGGASSAKVFKLRQLELPAGGSQRLAKRLSLAQMTTRVHYPGAHRVELLLNGRAQPLGQFELRAPARP
jgi:3-methyladenine DNA glycosylase AlkC